MAVTADKQFVARYAERLRGPEPDPNVLDGPQVHRKTRRARRCAAVAHLGRSCGGSRRDVLFQFALLTRIGHLSGLSESLPRQPQTTRPRDRQLLLALSCAGPLQPAATAEWPSALRF